METVGKIIAYAGKLLLFIVVTVIFIPSFLFVTYLQKPWNNMLGELFNIK